MRKTVFFTIGILTAVLMVVAGCALVEQTSAKTGRLIVNITDYPAAPEIDQVWLTITGVQVHIAGDGEGEDDGEWKDLPLVDPVDGKVKFDLLEFFDGSQEKVAVGYLEPGKYTQLRMDVKLVQLHLEGEYDDDENPILHEAKLPSDVLKFIHPFEIVKGGDTELLFDFDALKSVVVTGNAAAENQTYIFKPVVKVTTINQPFQISTRSPLPTGTIGEAYSVQLEAIGGEEPYTWSLEEVAPVEAGNSWSIDSNTGVISGTFTVEGNYTVSVKVTDNSALDVTKDFDVEIVAASP